MQRIGIFLDDIVEAKEEGKPFWWRWLDRLAAVFEQNFGEDWQKKDKDFWEKCRQYL
jgi:hypothetical protein